MFVDSHCHLDLLTLAEGQTVDDVVQKAKEDKVEHLLSVSVTLDRYEALLAQAARYENVKISCGLHPNELPGEVAITIEELSQLADNPEVVAIGETGLDYYRSEGDLTWQHDRFRTHITVAKSLKKPLIIHTRNAKEDTVRILKEEQAEDIAGVFHCFSEDKATAAAALDLGFYISFSGIVTFKNAKELQEVALSTPLDRILIETDSPYLAPTPKRGKPNFPYYVVHVAEKIAELKGVTLDEVAKVTTENYFNCFPLARP